MLKSCRTGSSMTALSLTHCALDNAISVPLFSISINCRISKIFSGIHAFFEKHHHLFTKLLKPLFLRFNAI